MKSDSLESEGIYNDEIYSHLFHSLPDSKHEGITEIEYCLFRLMSSLLYGSQLIRPISRFIRVLARIQWLAIICSLSTIYCIQTNYEMPAILRILNFFLYFSSMPDFHSFSPSLYFIVAFLSIISIITFFLGLFLVYVRYHFRKYMSAYFCFWIVDMPSILVNVVSIHTGYLIATFLIRENDRSLSQLIIYMILFSFHYMINYLCHQTIRFSVFYSSGDETPLSKSIFLGSVYAFFALFLHFLAISVNFTVCSYIFSVFFVVFTILYYYWIINVSYIHEDPTHHIVSLAITLFVSSLCALMQGLHIYSNQENLLYLIVGTYISLKILVNPIMRNNLKRMMEKLSNSDNYDDLDLNEEDMFLIYVKYGFLSGNIKIFDDSFILYGLNKFSTQKVGLVLLRYLTYLPKLPEYFEKIEQIVQQIANPSLCTKYMLYEFKRMQNLRAINELSSEHLSILGELKNKIQSIPIIEGTFSRIIGKDPNLTFLIIDSLGTMRRILHDYTGFISNELPNCPIALRVRSEYKQHVDGKYESSKRSYEKSKEIERDNLPYGDLWHMVPIEQFPLVKRQIGFSPFTAQIRRSRNFIQINSTKSLLFQPISSHKDFSGRVLRNIIKSNHSSISFFGTVISILFFLYSLIHMMSNVIYCLYTDRYPLIAIGFIQQFFQYIVNIPRVIIPPTAVLTNSIRGLNNSVDMYFSKVLSLQNNISSMIHSSFINRKIYDQIFNEGLVTSCKVPSYENGSFLQMNYSQFIDYFSGILNNMLTFENSFNCSTHNYTNFLSLSFYFPEFSLDFSDSFNSSMIKFLDLFESTSYNFLILTSIITLFIFILLSIYPLVIYREISRFTKLFRKYKDSESSSILITYLSRDHNTFWELSLMYYFFLILVIIIHFFSSFFENQTIQKLVSYLKLFTKEQFNDIDQHIYSYIPIISMYLSNFTEVIPSVNQQNLRESIDSTLLYFSKGSSAGTRVNEDRTSNYVFGIILSALKQISSNTIMLNSNITNSMYDIYINGVTPDIERLSNISIRNVNFAIEDYEYHTIYVFEISFALLFVLLIVFFFSFSKIHRSLPELVKILERLPEELHPSAEHFVDVYPAGFLFNGLDELNKNSIVELFEKPCALANDSGTIIKVNRKWISFFDDSPDLMVGQNISNCIDDINGEVLIYNTNYYNIYLIDLKKRSLEINQQISESIEVLSELKSKLYPLVFVDSHTNHYVTGFLTMCNIYLTSQFDEYSNPELISDRIRQVKDSIKTQYQQECSIDIIQLSPRQITCVFGIQPGNSPSIIVLSAFNMCVNVIRNCIEFRTMNSSISPSIVISSAEQAKLVYKNQDDYLFDIVGDVAIKQMDMNQYIDLNSITFCGLTHSILEAEGISHNSFKISDDIYQSIISYIDFSNKPNSDASNVLLPLREFKLTEGRGEEN